MAERKRVYVEGCVHFINLSNGLETLPFLDSLGVQYSCMRAQSSQCEAGKPEKLLENLPDSFLLALSLGYTPIVYDYGSRDPSSGVPRALWYGMVFIRWVLEIVWLGAPSLPPYLRGKDASHYFQQRFRHIREDIRRRLKYYRQFLPDPPPCSLDIVCLFATTPNDGQKAYYAQLAHSLLQPAAEAEKVKQLDCARVEFWNLQQLLDAAHEHGLQWLQPLSPAELQAKREKQKAKKGDNNESNRSIDKQEQHQSVEHSCTDDAPTAAYGSSTNISNGSNSHMLNERQF